MFSGIFVTKLSYCRLNIRQLYAFKMKPNGCLSSGLTYLRRDSINLTNRRDPRFYLRFHKRFLLNKCTCISGQIYYT